MLTAADPELAALRTQVRRAVDRLLDDGPDPEPPSDLATRTCRHVAEYKTRRSSAILEWAPTRVSFRLTDLAVAATIVFAGILTLTPALRMAREQSHQAGCTMNLRQIGVSLMHYASLFGQPPGVAPQEDAMPYAGGALVKVRDAGLIHDPSILHCPCRKDGQRLFPHLPSLSDLAWRHANDPASCRKVLDEIDYAVNLGTIRQGWITMGASAATHRPPDAAIPVVADRPAPNVLRGNSPNHHGLGQNVLFSDGHVHWALARRVHPRDDDIYLNRSRQPATPQDMHDAVLVPPCYRVDGR